MSSRNGTVACQYCEHWEPVHVEGQRVLGGHCYRFPPTVVYAGTLPDHGAQFENHRPYLTPTEHCGEFRRWARMST